MMSKPQGANGPQRTLRVLLVEDCQTDALLLERALQLGGYQTMSLRVDTAEAMKQALEQPWDVILADHSMPHFSAPAALQLVKAEGLDIPFIIVSGHIEETTAVEAMQAGAHDYIMKERLARLVPAVERELRESEVRRARRESEQELRRAHEELEVRVEQRTIDLRAANLKLQNVLEERKRLENELLEIAENERRKIGFDLHDDLGQKLTGVSLMLKGLEQKLSVEKHPCAAEAGNIQALINDVIHHTHNLAQHFSSLDVKGSELSGVLKDLAGNVRKMFKIPCGCTVKGIIPELPEHTTMQFYKIAQEAVSNAIKHGKATQLAISVIKDGDKLMMRVVNNGVPFSQPADNKNRMGLRIMNYRASTIGAKLEIEQAQGSGTVVTCSMPIKKAGRVERGDLERERNSRLSHLASPRAVSDR
ncbi:MAG TPA: response regulator [Clostridia bacterium]|nr:response regulator [Clostridia bacterium]